jgi:type II secretory pathway pseudopilin PulG
MSRRIAQKTEIKDLALAIQALKQAGIAYRVAGSEIYLTSGDFENARIDLKTGTISGDSDFGHSEDKFGELRQHYSEAMVRHEYLKTGTSIDSRITDQEGNIVLGWQRAAFG